MFPSNQDGTHEQRPQHIYALQKIFSLFVFHLAELPGKEKCGREGDGENERDGGREKYKREGRVMTLGHRPGTVGLNRIKHIGWDGVLNGMRCRILHCFCLHQPLTSSLK